MLPDFISFRKNIAQREGEFHHLLNSSEKCNNVHLLWAFDLELAFDGRHTNLQCLWQLSEDSCATYNTLHPTTVVVKVEEIIFEELSAIIIVEGVQEDLTFPDKINVPLIELFPTKEQNEIPFGVVRNISDWLDRCRFFFLYLWYPWDSYDDLTISDWAQLHLGNRLKLQYDIRNNVFDMSTIHYIQSSLAEAVEVVDLIENGDDRLPDDQKKIATIKNLIRKETIKLELNFFETPELKNPMIKYVNEKKMVKDCKNMLLSAHDNCVDISNFILNANSCFPSDTKIHISDSATHAVNTISSEGLLILSEGNHSFPNLGNLSYGGEIRGVSSEFSKTVIIPKIMFPKKYIFLNCFNSITFENLSIERSEGVLLCASQGTLRLKSCCIRGSDGCGLMVQSGCQLEMENCNLSSLATGIIAKKNSSVLLQSTTISNCAEGIKVMENASINLLNTSIYSCTVSAIVALSTKDDSSAGEVDILTNFADIKINNTVFENNKVNASIECY